MFQRFKIILRFYIFLINEHMVTLMPMEIKDKEKFIELLKNAKRVIVVRRLPRYIKIKVRTRRRLYTIKVSSEEEANEILKNVKSEVVEY